MSRKERLAWIALIGFALVLRLWALGARPPHHDEAIHCDFAYNLMTQGTYQYDPTYHGPLIYYVMAPLFALFGVSTAVGRACTRRWPVSLWSRFRSRCAGGSERGAAWWSGLLLAISPILLYYSRFAREDVPVAFFTALALTLFLPVRRKGWRVDPVDRRRRRRPRRDEGDDLRHDAPAWRSARTSWRCARGSGPASARRSPGSTGTASPSGPRSCGSSSSP